MEDPLDGGDKRLLRKAVRAVLLSCMAQSSAPLDGGDLLVGNSAGGYAIFNFHKTRDGSACQIAIDYQPVGPHESLRREEYL